MSTRTLEATGPLPPEQVWERFAVPGRWPEWESQIQGVELSTERLAAGCTGRLHVGYGVALPFTVDAVDEAARRFAWTVKVALLKLRLEVSVGASADGGSRAVMTASGPGPLVAGYAAQSQASLQRAVEPSS